MKCFRLLFSMKNLKVGVLAFGEQLSSGLMSCKLLQSLFQFTINVIKTGSFACALFRKIRDVESITYRRILRWHFLRWLMVVRLTKCIQLSEHRLHIMKENINRVFQQSVDHVVPTQPDSVLSQPKVNWRSLLVSLLTHRNTSQVERHILICRQ